MKGIVKKYVDTGECEIDIDRLVKKWNRLFWIAQYGEQYRLVKYKRKDSPITAIKVVISKEQFEEIRDRLNLVNTPDYTFKRASSWRKKDFIGLI